MRVLGSLLSAVALLAVSPFAAALAWLPPTAGLWIGRRVGDLLWLLLPSRRQIALNNLATAFGAERSAAERHRLARRSFQHLGMSLVELCALLFRPRALLSRITVDGLHHLKAAAAEGRGLLALSAHYGNWELLFAVGRLASLELAAVVRPMDNPVLDRVVTVMRQRVGALIIAKRHALRDILDALKAHRMVGMLVDQNAARHEGVFAPFFGRPASTTRAMAVIALRTAAPVLPMFIRREAGGRHVIEVSAPIVPPEDRSVVAYTALFNREIENAVRRAPDQWFWLHDRWRTRPLDEVPAARDAA
jgi:KDO2-lipid IV(A) lauroyltransferase